MQLTACDSVTLPGANVVPFCNTYHKSLYILQNMPRLYYHDDELNLLFLILLEKLNHV